MNTQQVSLKELPGFKELKVYKWGRYWYIVDMVSSKESGYRVSIGGYHITYGAAREYAELNYRNHYN